MAVEKIGPHSVVVTDSVRAPAFKDLNGKAIPAQMLPADGGLEMIGRNWAGRPPTVERRSERISWHAKIASKRVGVVS